MVDLLYLGLGCQVGDICSQTNKAHLDKPNTLITLSHQRHLITFLSWASRLQFKPSTPLAQEERQEGGLTGLKKN